MVTLCVLFVPVSMLYLCMLGVHFCAWIFVVASQVNDKSNDGSDDEDVDDIMQCDNCGIVVHEGQSLTTDHF